VLHQVYLGGDTSGKRDAYQAFYRDLGGGHVKLVHITQKKDDEPNSKEDVAKYDD
jgi:hypothetical protein